MAIGHSLAGPFGHWHEAGPGQIEHDSEARGAVSKRPEDGS